MEERERIVGAYRVGPEIGRGANGVVHEGVDVRLGRRVALKGLAAEDDERRERATREARILAGIRHPNVAVVHGVEEDGDTLWIALELLEGETLAELLARGAPTLEEALDLARQVAAGLEAAHERGVVHRDLSARNVVREADGTVKVLDFGLARSTRPDSSDAPTDTTRGVVVGTPPYMSPEQLRGREVDRRTDLWSFGCLLWELLTGRTPFEAPTSAELLGAILEREPDLGALPARTPRRVRELLERCLRKNPQQRLRDAGDARLELETALAERAWTRDAERSAPRRRLALPLVALATLVLGTLLGRALVPRAADDALRLTLALPQGERDHVPRLSPDGSSLVFEVPLPEDARSSRLAVRRLDTFTDAVLEGTERVRTFGYSPDGERLAVLRTPEGASGGFELVLVQVDGSRPPEFVCPLPPVLDTGYPMWLEDGRIALAGAPRDLLFVHTDGSARIETRAVVCDELEWPHVPDLMDVVPGGRHLLATSFHQTGHSALDAVVALDVATGVQTTLVEKASFCALLSDGRLLFTQSDVLLSAPFDADSLTVGEATPVESGLGAQLRWRSAEFHASRDGTVVWWPGGPASTQRRLSLLDGPEPAVDWGEQALPIEGFMRLGIAGRYLTCVVAGAAGNYELWGAELDAQELRPLLADPRYDMMGGVVDEDARVLYYCRKSGAGSELRRTALDRPGEGELLHRVTAAATTLRSPSLTDDRRTVLFDEDGAETRRILALDLGDEPGPARVVFDGDRGWTRLRPSSDGRLIAARAIGKAPVVMTLAGDGTTGPAVVLPHRVGVTGEQSWRGVGWARTEPGEPRRVLLWPPDSSDVHDVTVTETEEGLVFGEPRRLLAIPGKRMWDAAHLGGARFITALVDDEEMRRDRVRLLRRIPPAER